MLITCCKCVIWSNSYLSLIGRRYDEDGNAIRWWSERMINEYEKKADCFVDQFNEYEANKIDTNQEK